MDISSYIPVFTASFIQGLALGYSTWFVTWGINRAYLTFKGFTSF